MNYLQRIYVLLEHSSYEGDFLKLENKLKKEGIELAFRPAGEKGRGSLWITDSPGTAKRLQAQGKCVLAFFHEGNAGKDFSGLKYAMEGPEGLEAEYFEKTYRRLAGLPWDILETDRCAVRETTQADVDAFYEIYRDPLITKYTEGLYPSVEQEKQYVKEYIEKIYAFYNFGVWTVTEKSTGRVIGRAGFSYREGFAEPELGFVIARPWQGKGIAYEVCRAILEYGWEYLGFEGVNALVLPQNKASLRLCEKLGFTGRELLAQDGENYWRLYVSRP